MSRAIRREFTDLQKAEIFVRDHAICAFCGRGLWVLDYGANPSYTIDWIDHIKPISRGGSSDVDNGVCACYFCNSKKRNNGCDNRYLFREGKPTDDFFWHQDVISVETATNIRRFEKLVLADWFFNRALYRVVLGVWWIVDFKRGNKRDRTDSYYAQSAFKALLKWHRLVDTDSISDFATRNLVPSELPQDQAMMLDIQSAQTDKDVLQVIRCLYPFMKANIDAHEKMSDIIDNHGARVFAREILHAPQVTLPVKHKILQNLHRLYDVRLPQSKVNLPARKA